MSDRRNRFVQDDLVVGRNLGREFSVGEDVHGKITVRTTGGLYKTWDGRLAVRPCWVGTWWDRLLLGLTMLICVAIGALVSRWWPGNAVHWLVTFVAVVVAYTLGWWVSRADPAETLIR